MKTPQDIQDQLTAYRSFGTEEPAAVIVSAKIQAEFNMQARKIAEDQGMRMTEDMLSGRVTHIFDVPVRVCKIAEDSYIVSGAALKELENAGLLEEVR